MAYAVCAASFIPQVRDISFGLAVYIALTLMRFTGPQLQLFGAIWFAGAAGICFPLAIAMFPGPGSLQPNQLLPGIWSGLALYGLPAAIAGALLTRWIVAANAPIAFALGAVAVLLSAILAGPWLVVVSGRLSTLSSFASEAVVQALGQLVIDVLLLNGLPLVLGGFVAMGLKATVAKYGQMAGHER